MSSEEYWAITICLAFLSIAFAYLIDGGGKK